MDKNRKQIILLIFLIFIGINYALYQFFFLPSLKSLKLKEKEYVNKHEKLKSLINEKNNYEALKNEIDRLKSDTEELDAIAPHTIDTPQLVYDFYTACKKYGIKGEDLTFELENQIQSKNKSNQTNSIKNNSGSNDSKVSGVLKLAITLNASGNKNSIENFIRNLDDITKRKLNVKSISISVKEDSENEGQIPGDGIITEIGEASSVRLPKTDELDLVIVFYQYLQSDGAQYEKPKTYTFYDGKKGFKNLADMFK